MIADQDIVWKQDTDDCCQTEARLVNTSLSVDFQVGGGGTELLVKVDTEHPCGIQQIEVQLILIADPCQVWTLHTRMTESFEWKFGPNEARQLPAPIGSSISLLVLSMSKCANPARFQREIRRF